MHGNALQYLQIKGM